MSFTARQCMKIAGSVQITFYNFVLATMNSLRRSKVLTLSLDLILKNVIEKKETV